MHVDIPVRRRLGYAHGHGDVADAHKLIQGSTRLVRLQLRQLATQEKAVTADCATAMNRQSPPDTVTRATAAIVAARMLHARCVPSRGHLAVPDV
jgi:hypothetical protein